MGENYFQTAVTLTITTRPIQDLAPVANLTGLKRLYLHNLEVANLAPLAYLTNLESLFLMTMQATDIRPLAKLTKLRPA